MNEAHANEPLDRKMGLGSLTSIGALITFSPALRNEPF